jgi:hypothetical protein
MAKFKVTDTQACWVTWTYEVEAKDKDAAMDKWIEGDSIPIGEPEIGDSIDQYDPILEVTTDEQFTA